MGGQKDGLDDAFAVQLVDDARDDLLDALMELGGRFSLLGRVEEGAVGVGRLDVREPGGELRRGEGARVASALG